MAAVQAYDVLDHAQPRLMSRAEYDRLVETGLFHDERVELIHGMVVKMSPNGPAHADPIDVLTRHFIRALGDRAVVRVQLPFAASDASEPEPDLALVPPRRYADSHPSQAFLIIEVADTSLDHDRLTKAPLYATSGVPEYWIVDVKARRIEVYDTVADERYARVRCFALGESVAPAAFVDATFSVADLFV
jgi:Uma2 family endonuclease